MNNAIKVISPYKYNEMWVFDDEATGLVREPFVSGADKVIDEMVSSLDDPASGFNLIFSEYPFPGYSVRLDQKREEAGGWWYYSKQLGMEGWLCPALFLYYETAPETIYAKASSGKE